MALSTDYRIGPADDAAKFGMTEARVGVPFPAVPMIVVNSELPPQSARYCAMYASKFGADDAQRLGVFDELCAPGAMFERALEIAKDLASMPADSYRRVKRQVRQASYDKVQKVLASNADPMLKSWLSSDVKEASAAMLEDSS